MKIFLITARCLILTTALTLFGLSAGIYAQTAEGIGVDPDLGTLVTAEWLNSHINDPDLLVLDCTVKVEFTEDGGFRSVSGRPGYEAGHIPSAGFADLIADLSDTSSSLQFVMPSAEQFSAAMGALGVSDKSRVVLYDDNGSVWAARVWWMLRWIGFDSVALLDGGLGAWNAANLPLSTASVSRPAQKLTVSLRPEVIADRDEVFAAIGNDQVQIVDALPESHFRGEMVMYEWPGHIPGASNTPSSSLVNESGHYLPSEELATLFTGSSANRTITYCGGGIAASSDAFILTRLGFTNVAVYMGSLQEWTANIDNPMEVDTP
jgi:thiosulfate/3-mercaptopyruvate sulfurtransferase